MGYQPDIRRFIGERLGVGGLSSVYELQLPGRQKLAVKISSVDSGEQGKAFLRREANVLAQMDHPNIVAVHAYGSCSNVEEQTAEPVDFMVMALLEGFSLDHYLKMTMPFTPLETFMIARQTAEALQAVHQAGYAYNDVKPANLILTAGENYARKVMLIDFSLVERLGYLKPNDGTFRGTLSFSAPEKALGYNDRTDLRSDIFSLGITTYNLMFNRDPLGGPGSYLFDCRDLNLTIRRARLPRPLETVLSKMTAFELADRYQNCAEVVNAIDSAVASLR